MRARAAALMLAVVALAAVTFAPLLARAGGMDSSGLKSGGSTAGADITPATVSATGDISTLSNFRLSNGGGGCVGTLSGNDQICFNPNQMNLTAAAGYHFISNATTDFVGTLAAAAFTTTREFLVDHVSSGISAGSLLATGTNYSGFKLAQAWTLTHASLNVTTASTATAANTVITATDGTNTCTFTWACNTDTNTTGVKDKAGVNGAGTGCVYAAAALVTYSVTTQGCATAVTVNSISVWGKPQ